MKKDIEISKMYTHYMPQYATTNCGIIERSFRGLHKTCEKFDWVQLELERWNLNGVDIKCSLQAHSFITVSSQSLAAVRIRGADVSFVQRLENGSRWRL